MRQPESYDNRQERIKAKFLTITDAERIRLADQLLACISRKYIKREIARMNIRDRALLALDIIDRYGYLARI